MIDILNNNNNNKYKLNMSKQYRIYLLISYLNFLNAASISMTSLTSSLPTIKPATLLLPPGFDSQSPPLQPMLYPFAVPLSTEATRAALKNHPIITKGWIPMSTQTKSGLSLIPTSFVISTSTRNPIPLPVLEDNISQYQAPSSSYNNDSPVFESIVYGTWKPDPPLQPAEILNATKQQQQHNRSGLGSNSGIVNDGKVYNKTINRQHGGFIVNVQQKLNKTDKQNVLKNDNEKSSSSSAEYRLNESIELSTEQKQRKIKKQGRRKIRPNITLQLSATTLPSTTEISKASTEQITKIPTQLTVVEVDKGDQKPMEVVRQINDSFEIKYNHKQTSPNTIEMMTTLDNDDEQRWHIHTKMPTTVTTSSVELQQQQQQQQQQNLNELENTDATHMNWPADFMNALLSSTSPTTIMQRQSSSDKNYSSSFSDGTETESSELPLLLSTLNIPPSLWPKLPGNITKFGSPYETENSAQEPAICVPITVREHNIMNSNEIVHIERIFCFPMPNSTIRESLKDMRSRNTLSTIIKAKVQNFDDFLEMHIENNSTNLKSHFGILTYILVIYFKFIY